MNYLLEHPHSILFEVVFFDVKYHYSIQKRWLSSDFTILDKRLSNWFGS